MDLKYGGQVLETTVIQDNKQLGDTKAPTQEPTGVDTMLRFVSRSPNPQGTVNLVELGIFDGNKTQKSTQKSDRKVDTSQLSSTLQVESNPIRNQISTNESKTLIYI